MGSLRFRKMSGDRNIALYAGQAQADDGEGRLWALVAQDEGLEESMCLTEIWRYPSHYIFCDEDLAEVDLGTLEIPDKNKERRFIWCRRSENGIGACSAADSGLPTEIYSFSVIRSVSKDGPRGQVSHGNEGALVPVANLGLRIPNGTSLKIAHDDTRGAGFEILGDNLFLLRTEDSLSTGGPNLTIVSCFLSLTPDEAGRISYSTRCREEQFNQLLADAPTKGTEFWGAQLRYFYVDTDGSITTIHYPFTLPPWQRDQSLIWELSARIDPLLPHHPDGTGWTVASEQLEFLKSPYFRSVNGRAVEMVPREGAGFYLGRRPLPKDESNVGGYLCPHGEFDIRPTDDSRGRLMCGLSGEEHLEVQTGDRLHLLADRPAMAHHFSENAAVDPTLEPTFSTSWAIFQPGGQDTLATSRTGYYSQPSSSVYYAREQNRAFPTAVNALVRRVGDQQWPAVPVVPYGAVFETTASSERPANDVQASVVTRFESSVLSAQRFRILCKDFDGAVSFQRAQAPLCAGALTPQGLVVTLNDDASATPKDASAEAADAPRAGTWKELVFGRCGDQQLAFRSDDNGCVKPELVQALMQEDLFLVLNRWDAFTHMDCDVEVADFHFRLRPLDESERADETILVFKYSTERSLADLVGEPSCWSDPLSFVARGSSGKPRIDQAQQVLNRAYDVAERTRGNPNDPFVFFREQVWNQPGWTGVVAFNCPIDGNGMPPEMQMLLGGIDGPLLAHHVGIANNQISREREQAASIDRSSIFGSIFYDAGPRLSSTDDQNEEENDATYQVERLEVVIANSTLSAFQARVSLGFEQLFGRPVIHDKIGVSGQDDDGVDNRLVVFGRYQKKGAEGKICFNSKEDQIFRPPQAEQDHRVVAATQITGASLTAVSPPKQIEGHDKKSTVRARFALRGQLFFAAHPFGLDAADPVDLFTYGKEGGDDRQGLKFDKYCFDISFDLDDQGQSVGETKVVEALQDLAVTENRRGRRKSGVVANLPLKLTGMRADKKGLSKSALKGDEVHVLELREQRCATPHYAMEFDLPLGSLGALSGLHASLDASILLCWGPKTATPDEDGAAVWMQLPGISAGYKGFDIQGILKTVFGDANLTRVPNPNGGPDAPRHVWVLLFNNIALSVLGMTFPPQVMVDFILFADPDDPAGSNLGWSVSAVQMTKDEDEQSSTEEPATHVTKRLEKTHDG